MGWKNKLVFAALGIGIATAALSAQFTNLANLPRAILLLTGGVLLLAAVAWKKLLDKNFDFNDVSSVIAGVLGLVAILTSLAVLTGLSLWAWVLNLSTYAGVIVGLYVAGLGLTMK